MPRKTKAQLARSKAARKGWRTRRANERKRSEAAKRGWKTRRKNARKPVRHAVRPEVPAPQEEIIRKTYKKRGKRSITVEVVKLGRQIKKIKIDGKTFTRKSDIAKALPLFEASS